MRIRCFFLIKILSLFLIVIYVINSLIPKQNDDFSFHNFDNRDGYKEPIIPNIVHYIILGNISINFITFLSMASVLKVHRPETIYIHCDYRPIENKYWKLLKSLSHKNNVVLYPKRLYRPEQVFGQPLSSVYHATDVARIMIMREYGGIYLDTDIIVLKPLHTFLRYEMVVSWPTNDNFGTQVLIGHKDARFLKLWLEGYRRYRPRMWYYNAGQYPTEVILYSAPHLVHRVTDQLGTQNLLKELYNSSDWTEWKRYYALHLLSRHPPAPQNLDEYSIRFYDKAFGEIARWVLFDLSPTLETDSEPSKWKFD
ncbi:hypothetical protein O3M35_005087 [Rhynocoris fuscipes]|uniref:Alpha-1,4-N-acetylglucosaminyltransferase n=1 Tax=Rhynocoris fuscipes TaxID=488301 RepID=A0AAW1DP41_9HEMI